MTMPVKGRPRVNAPDIIRRQPTIGTKLVFDARWDVKEAPPNTEVGLSAVSTIKIEGAASAIIRIFHVNGKVFSPVATLKAPYANGKVTAKWRTAAVKGGSYQDGEYYFEVTVAGYLGVTAEPLVLRDASKRDQSSYQIVKPPLIKGIF
jgi:hypothetical protein